MHPDDAATAKVEALKREATLQVLFRVARLLDERAVGRVRDRFSLPGLRRAHLQLLPHLDFAGTRLTVLAERLGVSKQAVGPLVDELVEMGLLQRVPDPADGRAKLLALVGGPEALLPGLAVLVELERELEAAVGPARWAGLRDALLAVQDLLDEQG